MKRNLIIGYMNTVMDNLDMHSVYSAKSDVEYLIHHVTVNPELLNLKSALNYKDVPKAKKKLTLLKC